MLQAKIQLAKARAEAEKRAPFAVSGEPFVARGPLAWAGVSPSNIAKFHKDMLLHNI